MNCIRGLTNDIIFDCSAIPTNGIEKRVLMVNFEDIHRLWTTFDKDHTFIHKLRLIGGAKGFLFEGIKSHFTGSQKIQSNGFIHEVSLRIYHPNKENFEQINKAINGTFVAIVENNYKGYKGLSAFEVLGYDAGLKLTNLQREYSKTASVLTFSTSEVKELRMPYKWFDTDYFNTLEQFNNKLSEPKKGKIFDNTFDNTFE